MAVAYYVHLRSYCSFDACVAVAEAGDCGTTCGIEDTLTVAEGYVEAVATDDTMWGVVNVAVEEVGFVTGGCAAGFAVLDWLGKCWGLAAVAAVAIIDEGKE